jgi:hypothetical protein
MIAACSRVMPARRVLFPFVTRPMRYMPRMWSMLCLVYTAERASMSFGCVLRDSMIASTTGMSAAVSSAWPAKGFIGFGAWA